MLSFNVNKITQNSSVTRMINENHWKNFQERRNKKRLSMLYKMVNRMSQYQKKQILIPPDNRTRKKPVNINFIYTLKR